VLATALVAPGATAATATAALGFGRGRGQVDGDGAGAGEGGADAAVGVDRDAVADRHAAEQPARSIGWKGLKGTGWVVLSRTSRVVAMLLCTPMAAQRAVGAGDGGGERGDHPARIDRSAGLAGLDAAQAGAREVQRTRGGARPAPRPPAPASTLSRVRPTDATALDRDPRQHA
jgi:hypothetical protein